LSRILQAFSPADEKCAGTAAAPLDSSNPTAQRIEHLKPQLESILNEAGDRLEVVPAAKGTYVFIGNPKKKFGIAWIDGEKVNNFRTLVEERGVSPVRLERLSNELREAYRRSADEPRYAATVGSGTVVVTPSEKLGAEVEHVIREISG